jgi:hypothetical protein
MNNEEEALQVLRHIEAHLAKGVEIQKDNLALVKEQCNRSEVAVERSIKLQELSVKRQQRLVAFALPLILALTALLLYIGFKWHVF